MPEDKAPARGSGCIRIAAIIVLYKLAPEHSASFRTLRAAATAAGDKVQLKVLLCDNSPEGRGQGAPPVGVEYKVASHNAGLAAAYNWALSCAEAEGYDWLLTLDQDTQLPEHFLCRIADIAKQIESTPAVAAIVPQIVAAGRLVSPNWFLGGVLPRWFHKGFRGVPPQPTYAFNSAATLRVSALRQIGGYSPWFWLDNSDAYAFRQLHRHGKRVYVAGDIEVLHDFSMLNLRARITPERYRNVLLAESAFWDLEMGTLAGLERTARLAGRALKHLWRKDAPVYRHTTREFLRRRLFWTRRRRIAAWQAETLERFPGLSVHNVRSPDGDSSPSGRPKVSVCMATYNGEKYIDAQLRSILGQLHERDELVIVDDGSRDSTKYRVNACNDSRVRLIEHQQNLGVVATFEDAVRSATGDVIFLADQDDVWAPSKVERVLGAFQQHPEAQIVVTQVAQIDQDGLPSRGGTYRGRERFHAGFWHNMLRNYFQGSAMALRASLLHAVLPFPRKVGFLHDYWIGTRNAVFGGSVVFIQEPLLLYRRHSGNLSRKMSRVRQATVRLQLLWVHALRCLRNPRRN
jgi:glycosyltransferase involved in cell wall biosynthesis